MSAELLRRSVLELAELVSTGQISALELTKACLERIDALEPQINAFTHIAYERALADASGIGSDDPRPFAGVPIAIKDNRAVAGMPLTMCSDIFGDYVPQHDAFVVRRLRAAGFVIVGKTAMPENGILPTCEPRRGGPTANPWALGVPQDPQQTPPGGPASAATRAPAPPLGLTPGGSSGGSAAAVAAGIVPIAHGNDGGGSIRIPASCCGLVGLKPARARVSVGPDSGQSFLVGDGVLTRTVSETAALLDVLAGYELGDANWAPPPASPFTQASHEPPGRLRVGLALNPALESAGLDPECERAARDAAALLESLGHHVEEVQPPWSGRDLLPEFTRAFGPGIGSVTAIGAQIAGREPTAADVEPLTWEMYRRGREQDTITYLQALARLERVAREVVVFLEPYDVVVTPALAQRPVPTGTIHGRGPDPMDNYRRSAEFTPYTAIVNVTGQPAIALPLYQGEDGLPTAVQLIGRPAREDLLLSLAGQLEQALPGRAGARTCSRPFSRSPVTSRFHSNSL